MTLVVIGLISAITISFTGSMITQLQVSRDQKAAVHAELSAQSGLEFAKRQLLFDPLWDGTDDDPLMFTEGSAFLIERLPGSESKFMPTQVKLGVAGLQSAAKSEFLVHLRVDPGDPLLSKAVSVLGDTDGENIVVDGDILILDAPGWLWTFEQDLISSVQGEEDVAPTPSLDDSRNGNRYGQQLALDKRTSSTLAKESALGMDSDGSPDQSYLRQISLADKKLIQEEFKIWIKQVKGKLDSIGTTDDLLMHVRKEDDLVSGVWVRSEGGDDSTVDLSRVTTNGELSNFGEQVYSWAVQQQQLDVPVHAPGWDLDGYLDPSSDVHIFDGETKIQDLTLEKTAVFILDPGKKLKLKNVVFKAGMVVWCEDDFDFSGPARNEVELEGTNEIGDLNRTIGNDALIAPGCSFTVKGMDRHTITGFSVIHSLQDVKRFHHEGVLIILNSATDVVDSEFTFSRSVAISPPPSLRFFGNLPSVRIELQQEWIEL